MRPLIVVASEREGLDLATTLGLERDPAVRFLAVEREPGAGLYRGTSCDLVITGVLEHHVTAACALALRHTQPAWMVNFGAVGTYGASPAIGEVVSIDVAYRFDVDDNVHWVPPRTLQLAELDLPIVSCVTGSRYSTEADRRSPHFPSAARVEDMELYALAVLAETLQIPLFSIKYVTNVVGREGRAQFRDNVRAMRHRAEQIVVELVRS